ncbi:MAG: type II secretion system F family protein [Planctomycetes bacterium]|nr:type II secretion system F family protein [Planctomycetota bacterium]
MPLELLGLSLFFAFAVGLLAFTVIVDILTIKEEAQAQDELFSQSPLFKLALPFVQHIGRAISGVRLFDGMRRDISTKLVRAGKADTITPDEFIGFMLVSGCVGAVVGLYFDLMIDVGGAAILAFALLVMALPLLSLGETIKRRQHSIRKLLPYTLDLLCLAVEAGLDFTAALNRIADNLDRSPFRDELRTLSRDLSMGKTRPEALRDMEKRIGLEELTSVVTALIQADELGASLGPTLRIQSRELQRKRFQRAEKKAMQAPVLMLIPLVLFIFPLVFLVIFAPMALQILDQGLFF